MIQKISLVEFRGHNRVVEFGPGINNLVGPNESGKSTIKEAIAFVWWGTDSAGVKNPDHLITLGRAAAEVSLVTEHITITRRKRRGSTSTVKLTRHGLTPVELTQTELSAMLKISLDAFMSCWQVGYFANLMFPDRLKVLGELSAIDRRELLKSILPSGVSIPAKVKLVDPKVDANVVASERRQLQNVLASDKGAAEQVAAQITSLEKATSVDVDSYTALLNEVAADLEEHELYQKNLARWQSTKLSYETEVAKVPALKIELQNLKLPDFDPDKAKVEIGRLEKQIVKLEVKIETEQARLLPLPKSPAKPSVTTSGDTCPTCSQFVDDEHVNRVMGLYEKELLAYNQEAREVQTHNDEITLFLQTSRAEIVKLRAQIGGIEEKIFNYRDLKSTYDTKREHLESELKRIQGLKLSKAPDKPEGNEKELRATQLDLSTQVNITRRQMTELVQFAERLRLLTESIALKEKQVADLALLEEALKKLPLLETQKLLETLKIEGAQVSLEDGDKLNIYSDGIPYYSLSTGKRAKVGVEVCRALKKAAGPRAPSWLYLDDSDLIDRIDLSTLGQVFVAKVDPELTELMVVSL